MNARNLKLLLLMLMVSAGTSLRAQNALLVQQLNNFPDLPNDSAFEGVSYTFDAVVFNGTNSVVTGNLQLFMDVDTLSFAIGSPATQVNLNPGDTAIITIAGFGFGQSQFKAGNNIVVVWPSINSGITYPVDSLITTVYFVPLNSTGLPAAQVEGFQLYPNPGSDVVAWKTSTGQIPERVRIFDTKGRLVADLKDASSYQVSILPTGVYFIELFYSDATIRERFVKW